MGKYEDVKLLGDWPSPFSMKPRIALNLKKVDYELIVEKMNPKSELLLKSNPVHKKIPVLLHRGKPVYMDFRPPILPADPYDRAIARFWAAYIDDKWAMQVRDINKANTDEERAAAAELIFAGVQLLEEAFQTCGKGGNWFGGDNVGYVDITLGSYLAWIRVTEKMSGLKILDGDKFPQLAAWADRFCAEEAVKGVMPETDKLAEFAKMLMMKLKAASPAK
ncbi:unnamed protein product [Spirodela intermedia]|uniref:Glutathione S-transferase n=1 Tax=Spirodela intermedia TaxID=51605 RepID=A0A7I8IN95_SPIIN|nr:unnamed protein product [Spirodela intermedia]CAA6659034.1 unnamed protein product [Spirodela intermedia]